MLRYSNHRTIAYNANMKMGEANRDERKPKYNKIPLCAVRRLAMRFGSGERYDDPGQIAKLNGKMNWQNGNEDYWTDAYNHAIEHLMLSRYDQSDDHLAAVMWYCASRMYIEESGPKE